METKRLGRRTTFKQLTAFLDENGIGYDFWQKPENKTLKDLHKELRQGVCILMFWNGRVVRKTREAAVDVCYPLSKEVMHVLTEQWQEVMHGNRKHVRQREAFHTLKGKVKPDETYEHAAYRSICEKLGIRPPYKNYGRIKTGSSPFLIALPFLGDKLGKKAKCGLFEVCDYPLDDLNTESYPGIPTKRERRLYIFVITKKYQKLKERCRERCDQRTSYSWSPKNHRSASYLFQTIRV